jgi:hypothetical protein
MGLCAWFLVRLRGPLAVELATWLMLFVILGPVWFMAFAGGRFAADVGDDERCWPLTPLTAAWPKGGGGRFIFWV